MYPLQHAEHTVHDAPVAQFALVVLQKIPLYSSSHRHISRPVNGQRVPHPLNSPRLLQQYESPVSQYFVCRFSFAPFRQPALCRQMPRCWKQEHMLP